MIAGDVLPVLFSFSSTFIALTRAVARSVTEADVSQTVLFLRSPLTQSGNRCCPETAADSPSTRGIIANMFDAFGRQGTEGDDSERKFADLSLLHILCILLPEAFGLGNYSHGDMEKQSVPPEAPLLCLKIIVKMF